MRTAVVGALVAVALVVTALVLGPTIWAQVRGRDVTPGAYMQMLRASGGEIGVSIRELRSEEIAAAKLERPGGVFVEDVREGGPAARAGLGSGDIVVEFDGERVRGVRHFSRLVLETPPGRPVPTGIVRDGARQTIEVTPEATRLSMILPEIGREIERSMRALPRDFDFDFDFDFPPRTPRARLGITLTPLSDQLASYFGVREGVLVSAVESGSPAAQAGIRAGDVITTINGRTIDEPADVTASIRGTGPGSTLEIRLVRERKEMTVKATMPERGAAVRDRIPV